MEVLVSVHFQPIVFCAECADFTPTQTKSAEHQLYLTIALRILKLHKHQD